MELGTRGEQHRVALAVGDRVFIWYTHLVSACAELCDAASISVGELLLAAGERRDRRLDGGFERCGIDEHGDGEFDALGVTALAESVSKHQ